MNPDIECLLPPNDPVAFESLCLDLWKDIWGDPDAQKNGRSGQAQAGVDVFGQQDGGWVGVQCKQKDGLLRTKVTVAELNAEVKDALTFDPPLARFILATTGTRDAKVQARARQITQDHQAAGLFAVEVWSWQDIQHELCQREELLRRIVRDYLPLQHALAGKQKIAPSKLTHVPERLFGREAEFARLDAAWRDPAVHVITLVAWGGVGKTSLVAKWGAALAGRNYNEADYFDWSFYSQGTREQGGASADTFIAAALEFFGGPEGKQLAESPAAPWDKGAQLARYVVRRRTLLVLDGLEPLQHPPGPLAGQLKDPAIAALLKGLAAGNPGLCVVTTRERVADLASFRDTTAPEWELTHLSLPAGVELLKSLNVHGAASEVQRLVEDVAGHALTLHLLGRYLAKAHGGDIRRRDRVELRKADLRAQGGHAFKTMAAYARWLAGGGEEGARQLALLRLMGLFDRPADAGCLAALRREPPIPGLTESLVGLPDDDWNDTVTNLAECGLIAVGDRNPKRQRGSEATRDSPSLTLRVTMIDAHPLIREYFARQLREQHPDAWRAAHGRLYEHLRDSTKDKPQPTLEDLQPLYQAVAHGCQAGRQQEACEKVYRDRILRGTRSDGFYSTSKLGAFGAELGAVACFFEPPWSRVSPALTEAHQAWLLAVAAFDLRALGRLTEALEPMRAGLENYVTQENWKAAAIGAGNLSELELTLGELLGETTGAVHDAEQSVAFADRSGDEFQRMGNRTTLADALHQAGRSAEALALFREAEQMQAKWQPQYPLLYSLQGFQYCDLLLAAAERAAWEGMISHAKAQRRQEDLCAFAPLREILETCGAVIERAAQAIKIAERNSWLLDIGLDHLTLGRAGLYRAILDGSEISNLKSQIQDHLDAALSGLRRAGTLHMPPLALLTHAWLRFLLQDAAGALGALDEAWEIAERGPMPLHMADIHLHRARLFRAPASLAAARRLIDRHAYRRRDPELTAAEAAAQAW